MQDKSLWEPLKVKANELFNTEFVWYDGGDLSTVSIGVDWENMHHVLVDLDHPDGGVVQDLGLFEMDTVYTDGEEI